MIKSKSLFVAFVFAGCSLAAWSQEKKSGKYDLPQRIQEINKSAHPEIFLNEFLANAKAGVTTQLERSQATRDSLSDRLQLDYQALLLTVFSSNSDKSVLKIRDKAAKVFGMAFPVLRTGRFNNETHKNKSLQQLNGYISEINGWVQERGFLKGSSR